MSPEKPSYSFSLTGRKALYLPRQMRIFLLVKPDEDRQVMGLPVHNLPLAPSSDGIKDGGFTAYVVWFNNCHC